MRIINDVKLDFSDVLIQPKRSTLKSRKEVSLERTFTLLHSDRKWSATPICGANMDTVGTFELADALREYHCLTALHKHYGIQELLHYFEKLSEIEDLYGANISAEDYVFYSLGIGDSDLEKLESFEKDFRTPRNICIDVANGYTQTFVDFVKRFRDKRPNVNLMVGNVVTSEMTEELILSGADIVKVGIGPGSVCTTRKMTGVGYPQLSAVIECADAAHGVKGMICSDGGCTVPGDFSKAFGAGADLVMAGGYFAGHDESGGEKVYDSKMLPSGQIIKSITGVKFYGMSSDTAMNKHNGGVAEYRASEGKTVVVPYKGKIDNTMQDLLGGIRSTCTYTGSQTLKELPKRCTFLRVNNQINNIFTGKEIK